MAAFGVFVLCCLGSFAIQPIFGLNYTWMRFTMPYATLLFYVLHREEEALAHLSPARAPEGCSILRSPRRWALFVAKTEDERQQAIRSIGPVWDGNEVWLLAAGGTLLYAFPLLYPSAFSGFYLPLMIVLWLLMLRGISVELRSHSGDQLWRTFFDGLFSFSSVLLAIFFGAALANVIRGVPIGVASS